MVKAFEKVAFTLKEHGLSKPVKTQFGWHVIEVLGKRPAQLFEQIHARHILVGSEKLAWKILKKLGRNRESFDVLAATHSLDDSNKSRGGDLNWFPRGIMVKAFEKVAFTLKEHGLSKPVKTQFGWHVIEVLGKRPAHIKSLNESRDEITNLLQQKGLDQWIDKLILKADVTILKPEYQMADQEVEEAAP